MKTKLILDVNKTQHAQLNSIVTGRVGDKISNVVDVYVIDGGSPYNLTGSKVFFECVKPDNTVVRDDSGVKMIDAAKGHFEYTFPTETFGAIGKAKQAFMSIEKDTTIRATTQDFVLITLPDATTNRIPSESYFSDLEKLIQELNEMALEEINSKAAAEASAAKDFANQANELSNSVQNQLNTIVIKGDSSVEAAQARVDEERREFNTLKDRLDYKDRELNKISATNAQFRLTLLSAYDDIDAYHPKVINFGSRWNGYYYWMAFTPYPGGNQAKENPHVLASNDMITWVEPAGYKNPLEPQPPGTPDKQYQSDTHIVYNPNFNRIEVYWRYVDDSLGTITIYRKTSTNGVNWSEKEIALQDDRNKQDYLSPAIIFEDNKYKMWAVGNGYKVIYAESALGTNWGTFREINIPFESPMNPWHLDVIHTDQGYEMVVVAFKDGQDRNTMSLFHSKSNDNVNYSTAKEILSPSNQEFTWDNRGIYRSSITKIDGIYYIYYSGVNKNWERGTGLTFGEHVEHLKGLDRHDLYIQSNVKAVNMVYEAFLRNYGLQISAPQSNGSLWKACLKFSSASEVKFVDDFSTNTLISLAVEAIRTNNGLKFIGKSAYYNANEFKLYEPGKASMVGLGEADFFRPKLVGNPAKAGGMEVSAVIFEDAGRWAGVEREGAIRYDAVQKKHLGYDGTKWNPLY
ncbi:BppU family phage baseplate upper protein [Bacillus mycoides]